MSGAPSDGQEPGRDRERRRYLIGGALTFGLTAVAFGITWARLLDPVGTRVAIAVLAVVQIIAHFHYFLHIDPRKSHRDDLMLILFTGLIMSLMIGGTIWILFDQWSRMM